MGYDGSFLKLNGKMLMKWLSELSDIHVFISSYSKTAEAENTERRPPFSMCSK